MIAKSGSMMMINCYHRCILVVFIVVLAAASPTRNKELVSADQTTNASLKTEDLSNAIVETATNLTSVIIDSSNTTTTTTDSWLAKVKQWVSEVFKGTDKYTLILTSAFLAGILLIALLIALAFCICKNVNRFGRRKKKLPAEMTNPAYDLKNNNCEDNGDGDDVFMNVKYKPVSQSNLNMELDVDQVSLDDEEEDATLKRGATLCKGEDDFNIETPLLKKKTKSQDTLTKDQLSSSSSSPSSSDSSLSFDNVPIDSPTKSIEKPTSTKKAKSPPRLTDFTDHTPLFRKNNNNNNNHNSNSKLFARTNSELKEADSKISLKKLKDSRKSIASSTTSIQQQPQPELNFSLIQNDIDDMAVNKKLVKSESTSSQINSNNNNNTTNNSNTHSRQQINSSDSIDDISSANKKNKSISDIYMDYIKSRRLEQSQSKQQRAKQAVDIKPDDLNLNKRHSALNVSVNPNGPNATKMTSGSVARLNNPASATADSNNASNLVSNDSMSVETVGSEKSCY